ncbi:hypothetical protein GS399_18855 [Pedobacter sp. HMF7647]|uniref:Uncharacterized protein n=1 Tax=Hufsiella arboris TaxID=2695275 RepID=A0A7K1YEL4_9SPHI|nr:hypothetical protein [Hufsiella arboris]MXV53035.1 hypothetical protein [Hufsiella arboris]
MKRTAATTIIGCSRCALLLLTLPTFPYASVAGVTASIVAKINKPGDSDSFARLAPSPVGEGWHEAAKLWPKHGTITTDDLRNLLFKKLY